MNKQQTGTEVIRIELFKPDKRAEMVKKIKAKFNLLELKQFLCSSYTANNKLRKAIILPDMPNENIAYQQAKKLFLNEPTLKPFFWESDTNPSRSDRILMQEYKG